MQVGRRIITTAPVQRAWQFINKTGKATVAAVAIGAAALGAHANTNTNTAQQVTAPTQLITASTNTNTTTKASLKALPGFSPTVYGAEMTITGMTVNKDEETLTLEYRLVQKPNALKLGWKKELTDKNWEIVKEDLPYKESGVDALGRTNYVGSETVDKKDPHKGFYRLIDSGLNDK